MTKFILLAIIALTFSAAPVWAESAPVPARKTEALSQLKSRIETEISQQSDLKKKMSSAEDDLGTARKSLVKLSADLQTSQKTMTDLESRIKKLEGEEATLNTKIQSDYGSMGDLILAMERIRRMPTETLIIRPGAPLETAQSAILLRSILPGINARTAQMSADLERLRAIHISLDKDRTAALATAEQLKGQEKELQAMLKKRETLYRQTRSAYEIQAESVARMAAEAQSLEQLVARIERAEAEKPKEEKQSKRRSVKMPSLPGGRWAVPVQGNMTTGFGQQDSIGAKSEGIRISAGANALVTAPVAGVVRFAGPFRNYGNMVIIEHDKGFHSLMSGLSRIDTAVGRKISAGEPVGTLAGSGNGGPPTLYYELRHNGKPVDPSAKFPDLS
jgi:septal ring factor EnvC (AmiA/AmiB activator)